MKITGTFEVNLQPLANYATGKDGVNLGRMSIDKTFAGPLSATSQGEMLNAMVTEQGSGGYVAIEQVVGEFDGKSGSFVLQHYGLMTPSSNSLLLEVIPNSGTGELTGLSGKMAIRNEDGQHYYDFEYQLT